MAKYLWDWLFMTFSKVLRRGWNMCGRGRLNKKDEFILKSLRESVGLTIHKNKKRNCLKCDKQFKSDVNRICDQCRFVNKHYYVNQDYYVNHIERGGMKRSPKSHIYSEITYPDLI